MAIDTSRVIEVWAPADGTGTVGSGYLVASGLVLTAGHVVDAAASGRCEVRALGTEDWLGAERVWRGKGCDAALLRVGAGELARGPAERVALGRVAGAERVACQALGFPWAQERPVAPREVERDTERLEGQVDPLSRLKGGALTVHIRGSVPEQRPAGHSPWEGMSGAALFSGSLLCGLVVVDPAHFGSDRLEGVPVATMAAEPGFFELLTGDPAGPLRLTAVEAQGVLRDPHRPLPAQASPQAVRGGVTSLLLRPEFGVVPFRAREGDMDWLEQWCGSGAAGLAVALLLGRGGTGKTRLAAEFCSHQQLDRGIAGFLEASAPADGLRRLAGAPERLLVVIDEAHAHVNKAAEVIASLTHAERSAPTAVLLVARQAGDWWDHLLPARLDDEEAELALATAAIRELAPVDQSPSGREEAFRVAARAFAERMQIPPETPASPDLSEPLFEPILFVHLAALSALEGEASLPEHGVVRRDLLEFALKREARYWAATASGAGLTVPPRVLERAVATATLTTASDEREAADALAAVPDLADADQQSLRDLAWWLRDLYPAPTAQPTTDDHPAAVPWFRPLTPDLIGEALVAQVVEAVPELVTGLLDGATPTQAGQVLTALTQAAGIPGAERALRQALAEHLPSVWAIALEVAEQSGDPLGRVLAEVLEDNPQPQIAAEMVAALPDQTVALRELGVVATRQALEHVVQQGSGVDGDAEAAHLLNNLSYRLSELGRPEQALEASEEAVATYRQLAEARPDAFLPALAGSLNNLSNFLSELGRPEQALEASEEAVATYRQLAEARPDAFLPALATSLNNLSNFLSELGRPEQALEAIEEAVHIRRQLAEARPDAFLPDLAGSLNNLSNFLSELGRPEQALEASEEAVATYRQLAEARPDAFLPALAMSLNNLSNRLSELGRREQALEAIEEAVHIRRQLAEARPDAFLPDLAGSLNNLSNCLSELGRPEQALEASEEAVATYRQLAEARPDAFLPDLAGSLNNLSNCLSELGRPEQALEASEEAVATYRQLAEARPDAFLPALAMSLNNLSNRLSELGRPEQALEASEEAIRVILPMLERAASTLPDAGLGLAQTYLHHCEKAAREPQDELVEPLYAVLVAAGVISGED